MFPLYSKKFSLTLPLLFSKKLMHVKYEKLYLKIEGKTIALCGSNYKQRWVTTSFVKKTKNILTKNIFFRDQVCKQLVPEISDPAITSCSPIQMPTGCQNPVPERNSVSEQNSCLVSEQNSVSVSERNSSSVSEQNSISEQNSSLVSEQNSVSVSERNSSLRTEPLPRPSWASSFPSSVPPSTSVSFDVESKFWLKPDFLRVIRSVEGVDQKQLVFRYKEVTFLFQPKYDESRYYGS